MKPGRSVAALLLLFVCTFSLHCGGKPEANNAGSPPPAGGTSPSSRACDDRCVAAVAQHIDKACACKNRACLTALEPRGTELWQQLSVGRSDAVQRQMRAELESQMQRAVKCAEAIPFSREEALREQNVLIERGCACKSHECFNNAQRDLAMLDDEYRRINHYDGLHDDATLDKQFERFLDCYEEWQTAH